MALLCTHRAFKPVHPSPRPLLPNHNTTMPCHHISPSHYHTMPYHLPSIPKEATSPTCNITDQPVHPSKPNPPYLQGKMQRPEKKRRREIGHYQSLAAAPLKPAAPQGRDQSHHRRPLRAPPAIVLVPLRCRTSINDHPAQPQSSKNTVLQGEEICRKKN